MSEVDRTIKIANDFFEKGLNFVMEQSPEMCTEILYRGMIVHSLSMLACALLMLVGILSFKKFSFLEEMDEEGVLAVRVIIRCFSLIFALPFFIVSLYNILLILLAPRLYLLEYFTGLLN